LAGGEWQIPAPDERAIEIIEALWGDVAVVNNEIVVLKPGTCDVQTEVWQEAVDVIANTITNRPVLPWAANLIDPETLLRGRHSDPLDPDAPRQPLSSQEKAFELSRGIEAYIRSDQAGTANLLAITPPEPDNVLVIRYKIHGQEGIATLRRFDNNIQADPDPEEYGNERQVFLRDRVEPTRRLIQDGEAQLRGVMTDDARRLLELRQKMQTEHLERYRRLIEILLEGEEVPPASPLP